MPRVSVVIPNWNGMKHLRTCLDALKAQAFRDFETIIVDNASRDGSVEFIRERYPEVIIIANSENVGFSRAVNAGIRAASGEIIALLNNDTDADPDWLSAAVSALDRHPGAGMIASRVMFMDRRDIIDSCGDIYTPWGAVFNRGHDQPYGPDYGREEEIFGICASAALVRREVFDTIGLFEENFFAYYEDIDLNIRVRLAGWKCIYAPDAVMYHGYSSSTSGRTVKLGREEVYLHLTCVWLKNTPSALMLRHLPSALAFHSMIIAFFLLARLRGKAMLPRVPFFSLMKKSLAQRKTVKSYTKVTADAFSRELLKLGFLRYILEELKARRG